MKTISVQNDIIPIAEFKASISKYLKNLRNTRHPLVITQNGKPAAFLSRRMNTTNSSIENPFWIPCAEHCPMLKAEGLTAPKRSGLHSPREETRDNFG